MIGPPEQAVRRGNGLCDAWFDLGHYAPDAPPPQAAT
jgi:hypothetical protein